MLQGVENRAKYEFPRRVKREIIRRQNYCCACCKNHQDTVGKLEVHHSLPIFIAYNCFPFLAPRIIQSIENAVGLCHDCHAKIHIQIDHIIKKAQASPDQDTVALLRQSFQPIAQALLRLR